MNYKNVEMVRSTKALPIGALFMAMAVSTFAAPINVVGFDKAEELTSKACDSCEAVFARAEEALTDPRLIANTVGLVEETICMRLPEEGQAKCNDTMSTKIPAFLNGIADKWLQPTADCQELGFCHKNSSVEETNGLKCDVCTKVMEFVADDVLQNQKVEDFATDQLDTACELLPESYAGLCETAANASVPEILSYIGTFLESNGCTYIGFCDTAIIEWPDLWTEFQQFIHEFKKSYTNPNEFKTRFEVFQENFKYIMEHKSDKLQLAINKYADMTPAEFGVEKKENCFVDFGLMEQNGCMPFSLNLTTALPATVDWRQQGAVTPVKNQGACGSCWSFSATGAMEGAYYLKHKKLLSFAEQELVDCSGAYGNMGCNGGLMDSAFEFAIEKGMCTESEDPYKAHDERCGKCEAQAQFSGCMDVANDDESELMKAVAQQPVSVAIEADHEAFMFYRGGIIDDVSCGTKLDHGVLVVGYGEDNGSKYWLIKNSWGESWGENGYVRIARDETEKGPGICGIASQPSFILAE